MTGQKNNPSQAKIAWMFMLPFLAIFFCFTVVPVVASMFISFTNFNILQPPQFIGFANFIRLFVQDAIFMTSLKNTIVFAIVTGPVSYVLCFSFAWFINQIPRRPRSWMTLFFYAPSIAGNMFIIWTYIFSNDAYGLINSIMINLGVFSDPVQWLTDPTYMSAVVIIVVLWQSLGAGFLAFIAGLQNVDVSLYEAASVDGITNRWQELYFITLPCMKPQLMFGAVMQISASFGIGSIITALVGYPSTDYAVHTVVNHLEDFGGIRFEMGYACAIATILFVIMITTNKLVQRLINKVGK
jgi:multiple sugar transport system permease protein